MRYAGTVLAHRTRWNAGDGVPYGIGRVRGKSRGRTGVRPPGFLLLFDDLAEQVDLVRHHLQGGAPEFLVGQVDVGDLCGVLGRGHGGGVQETLVLERDGEAFVPKYKKLLYTTPIASAEDTAKVADIDLTDKEFWRAALKTVADQIDLFCQIVEKK